MAGEFAKTLGCTSSKGCYRSDRYIITYCLGHLYRLWEPGEYRPEWKKWSIDALPILPAEFRYEKDDKTAEQADIVTNLVKAHIHNDILVATDAGREGELIARIVLREAGLTDISRCRRFWVSEALTPEVIREGISSAKPLSDYNITAAQGYARQHADWLVGMNFSRFVTLAGGNSEKFSVGRVQSAVLSAIVIRHDRAVNFIATPYNELEAALEDVKGINIKAVLINPETNKSVFPVKSTHIAKAAEYAMNNAKNSGLAITVSTAKKIQRPEKLFNLTALQKTAFKFYGYSPEETLGIAQSLYEKHKCLSYPRTPSRVMGDNNVGLFREKFDMLKRSYQQWSQFSIPALIDKSNRHIFNSSELEDHHALIPLAALPDGVTIEEKNVFELVVKQFFVVCMPNHVWTENNYLIKNGPYNYSAVIREIIEIGWKKVYEKEKAQEGVQETLGKFDVGNCRIKSVNVFDKKTSPPKPYQIDSLLAFMERPRPLEDKEEGKLAELGTPATRAEIIKNLFDRKYIIEDKKYLVPTKKGEWLIKRLNFDVNLAKLTDVEETTSWEKQLQDDPANFENLIINYVKNSVKTGDIGPGFEKEILGTCPLCGGKICEGKKSYFCSSWNNEKKPCKFTIWKTIAGAKVAANDVKLLLSRKKTGLKNCVSKKEGKQFKTQFRLKDNGEIEFVFDQKGRKPPNKASKGR